MSWTYPTDLDESGGEFGKCTEESERVQEGLGTT